MTPYATQALAYLSSGLGWPIPSSYPFEKHPPLAGWTGRNGKRPTEHQVERWIDQYPNSNILLRMAPNVIGIDVDQYDDKHGGETLSGIADTHGELPPTWKSSARPLHGASGIYWLQLHTWMESDKMRDPGDHIEVIRYEHRYAVAPPSWHQGARAEYRWNYGGTNRPPSVGDLDMLPTEWYIHLTRGCGCFESERAERKLLMQRVSNRPPGEAGKEAARQDLDRAAATLWACAEGSRNNMLSSMAGRFLLYDFALNSVLTADEITTSLRVAAINAGLPLHEAMRTIDSALDWAIREGTDR